MIEIEAVAAQILPTTDTPGAREAGVIYFIDHALATFDRSRRRDYQRGLADLQTRVARKFSPVRKFSELDSARQVEVLREHSCEGPPLSVIYPRATQHLAKVRVFAEFAADLMRNYEARMRRRVERDVR